MTVQILDVRRAATMGKARLITIQHWGQTQADLWCEVQARKIAHCAKSGKRIERGDPIYRPVTNKAHRSLRILVNEVP